MAKMAKRNEKLVSGFWKRMMVLSWCRKREDKRGNAVTSARWGKDRKQRDMLVFP